MEKKQSPRFRMKRYWVMICWWPIDIFRFRTSSNRNRNNRGKLGRRHRKKKKFKKLKTARHINDGRPWILFSIFVFLWTKQQGNGVALNGRNHELHTVCKWSMNVNWLLFKKLIKSPWFRKSDCKSNRFRLSTKRNKKINKKHLFVGLGWGVIAFEHFFVPNIRGNLKRILFYYLHCPLISCPFSRLKSISKNPQSNWIIYSTCNDNYNGSFHYYFLSFLFSSTTLEVLVAISLIKLPQNLYCLISWMKHNSGIRYIFFWWEGKNWIIVKMSQNIAQKSTIKSEEQSNNLIYFSENDLKNIKKFCFTTIHHLNFALIFVFLLEIFIVPFLVTTRYQCLIVTN